MNKDKFKGETIYCTNQFKKAMANISEENPNIEPLSVIMGMAITLGLSIGAYERFNHKKIPMKQIEQVIRENVASGKREASKIKKGG